MQDTLRIGLIVKPQGVKGEVKIQPLTDDINRFKRLKKVIIDGAEYIVERAVIGGGTVFLSLFGITDRDTAESFRGKFVCVTREDAVKLPKDNYFIVDIIGCKLVLDSGKTVGEITEVTTARTDIFTVLCANGKLMRFPFLKDVLVGVDVENKVVTVKEKRLSEVACYED